MHFAKKIEVGLQTTPLPQTLCIAYGKGKNENLFLQWSKYIPINRNGQLRTPLWPNVVKITIFYRNSHLGPKPRSLGSVDHI